VRIFVTGASGLVGRRLVDRLLERGDEVLALSRRPATGPARPGLHAIAGDLNAPGSWQQALAGAGAVVHLAGEPLAARRWSPSQKRRLEDSRIEGTRHLVDALLVCPAPPSVLVSASAVGFYGARGEEELDEASPAGTGFLASLCQRWEAEAQRAAGAGVRTVVPRLGVVLSARGGALTRLRLASRLFVGGPLGRADGWFPWIHEDDVVGLLLHALADPPGLRGPLNVVAPEAVCMRDFARAIGRTLHRPAGLPLPEPLLRLVLGEVATAINPGQRVIPRAALASGYRFLHPSLHEALAALWSRTR
jgi:uncharacterized protein (TIGR01777 family)